MNSPGESHLRHDRLDDRWVVVAPSRARRPRFVTPPTVRPEEAGGCPFCPGNESETRGALWIARQGGELDPSDAVVERTEVADWQVRVFPNLYPMFTPEAATAAPDDVRPGVGAHEVVVETPRHEAEAADLSVEEAAQVVHAWQARTHDLVRDRRFQQVLCVKNRGALSGATVRHAHSQIVASASLPTRSARRLRSMREHHRTNGGRLVDELAEQTREDGRRVVRDVEGWVTSVPYAPASRYETTIVGLEAPARFADFDAGHRRGLAAALVDVLRRMRSALGDPPYNLAWFSEPNVEAFESVVEASELEAVFRPMLVVRPCLAPSAAYEWASDTGMHALLPEEAADHLREASVEPHA